DAELDLFTLQATHAVVIGVGNVAVDVARVLTKKADVMAGTDVPGHVLDVLAASAVTEVTMLGRRGPAYARFTTKELRELGEISGSDIIVDPADLELTEQGEADVAADRTLRANAERDKSEFSAARTRRAILEVLREWSTRTPEGRPRRLRIKFWLRPVEVLGSAGVTRLQGRTSTAGDTPE